MGSAQIRVRALVRSCAIESLDKGMKNWRLMKLTITLSVYIQAIFLKGSQRFKISFVVFIRKIVVKGCHSVFSPNVIGHTGRILSICRQPEVIREYFIFFYFSFFVNLFPIYCRCCATYSIWLFKFSKLSTSTWQSTRT